MKHTIKRREVIIGRVPFLHMRCNCGSFAKAYKLRHQTRDGAVVGVTRAQASVMSEVDERRHRKAVKDA